MKSFLKAIFKVVKYIFLILLMIAFVTLVPAFVNCFLSCKFGDKAVNYDWINFWGGYLGGAIGGVATLLAVVFTIKSGRKDQDKANKLKNEEVVKKSALIVYYDFYFAFENIESFMIKFWKNRSTKTINVLSEKELSAYINARDRLNQFYFNSDWIKTVADLKGSEIIGIDSIKKIYEIYGHLMTIDKSLKSDDYDICKSAFNVMTQIVNPVFDIRNFNVPEKIYVKDDIKEIMEKLEIDAEINTSASTKKRKKRKSKKN